MVGHGDRKIHWIAGTAMIAFVSAIKGNTGVRFLGQKRHRNPKYFEI